MKGILHSLPYFITAFLITAVVIASLAAVSVLGDSEKALYFDSDSGKVYFFGQEYVINTEFLSSARAVFDFNGVFLGKTMKNGIATALEFCVRYIYDAFCLMFGFFRSVINNCV